MTKIYRLIMAAGLMVCGCLWTQESVARVCFAPDANCDTGANFHDDGTLKLYDDKCAESGYDQKSCQTGQLKYVCPFRSSWVKCCNMDYNYSSCIYPMVSSGECGGKYKCLCDNTKFKYSYDGIGGSTKCDKNSTPGGASCIQQVLNSSGNGLDIQTFYTECRCDRALYPYTPDICDENAEVGDTCIAVDHTGQQSKYFSACYCDRQIYKFSAAGCSPYVGDEKSGRCSSGGTTYYKSCKSCQGYPAQNLDHVGYNNGTPDPEDYETCPYRQVGDEYKIKACRDPGYRVSRDGDYDVDENGERIKDKNGNYVKLQAGEKCIPMECEEAAQYFVAKVPTYGIFDGSNIVDENGKTVNRASAIIAKDISVSAKTCSVGGTVEKRVCNSFCCKYKFKEKDDDIWDEDEDGNELGKAIITKQCTKSCCSIRDGGDGGDAGEHACESGATSVNADTWGDGTKLTCPTGTSLMCTETKDIVSYDKTETEDGEAEYELDPSCTSAGAYDITYTSTPEDCPISPREDAATAFQCSKITKTDVSNSTAGLACTPATTYYSGLYLAKTMSNNDAAKALKVACRKVPTITYNSGNFPNNTTTNYTYIYGTNMKLNSTTIKAPTYIYDGNITISGTLNVNHYLYFKRNGYVNDGTLNVQGGYININKEFKSYGYDYKVQDVRVNTDLYTTVFFSGDNATKTFRGGLIKVNGLVGFHNYDIYADANIGESITKSGISLHSSTWYMWERDTYTNHTAWMRSMAYIGTPTSCSDGAWAGGPKIIFSNDRIYKALVARDGMYNGEDNQRPSQQIVAIRYITSGGSKSSYSCSGKGNRILAAGVGHSSHSKTRQDVQWWGNSTSVTANYKHGCKMCVY